MDEDEYRAAHKQQGPIRCAYEKSLVSQNAQCDCARQMWIADRVGFACSSALASGQCHFLLGYVRLACGFMFATPGQSEPLAHNKEMRVQCGGLIGLSKLLEPVSSTTGVINIRQLQTRLKLKFENFESIPFSELLPDIAKFNPRPQRNKN